MKISENGVKLISGFEGFSAIAYICAAGKRTIGYGHVIKPNEQFSKISKEQAMQLLKSDIEIAEDAVNKLVLVALTQNQFDALVSFVFNIGAGAFKKSTMLKLINSGKIAQAAEEFKRWIFASGKEQQGLTRRREAEKLLFVS